MRKSQARINATSDPLSPNFLREPPRCPACGRHMVMSQYSYGWYCPYCIRGIQ